jgi:glycosyltransferase involved in cell wall biosynthesis
MKTVLIVAFHFPPYGDGSGILRILKFCRFLPENGWRPVVLTANTRAYERTDPTLLAQIPPATPVTRAFALDTQRHLSVRGRYARWMALPDRWSSWLLAASAKGLQRIRKHKVDVILSTYPIATAVLIGLILHTLTRKPWVVDFRDSMTEDEYPADTQTRKVYRWIEAKAVKHAMRLIFTSPSAIKMYQDRYPSLNAEKVLLIPNGYDEEDFRWVTQRGTVSVIPGRPVRLLHLGLIYPSERDPRPFFRALCRLKKQGQVSAGNLRIELRASGSESYYATILRGLDIDDIVLLLPPLSYPEAIREAAESDALLLFQAANCNHQIPAKAYEYLRLGRPILALTSHTGDTAALLQETGGANIVDIADEEAIFDALPRFLATLRRGEHSIADLGRLQKYARSNQSVLLAESLLEIVSRAGDSFQPEPESMAGSKIR